MSTVPKADTPPPANNASGKLVSDAMSGNYGRPASGGPPVAGKSEGNAPTAGAAPGVIPSNPITGAIEMYPPTGSLSQAYDSAAYLEANAGAAPSTGGTQVGPDMGSGATVVSSNSGDRPSGGKDAAGLGTVGDSGNQGLA